MPVGHREATFDAARRWPRETGLAHTTARDLVAASNIDLAPIGHQATALASFVSAECDGLAAGPQLRAALTGHLSTAEQRT